MESQTRTVSRGAFIAIIASAATGFVAILVTAVVVALPILRPPQLIDAQPGQDVFDALRMTDRDVEYLGLNASEGGRTPSTLATAASAVANNWRDADGRPAECTFAGTYPGAAVFPVWGSEDETDPLWAERSVSATQTLSDEFGPFVWLTVRTFESDAAAVQYLLDHNQAVPGCPSFTINAFQREVETTLVPLMVDTLEASNTGWVAETRGWVEAGAPLESMIDLQTWVLNVQHGNVVERVVMVVAVGEEAEAGPYFTALAELVARKLVTTVAVD